MFRIMLITLLAMVLVVVTGCGTFANLAVCDPPTFYGGTSHDADVVTQSTHAALGTEPVQTGVFCPPGRLGLLFPITLGLIDLPFSFIGDTLTLPYVYLHNSIDQALKDFYVRDHPWRHPNTDDETHPAEENVVK